MHIGVFAHLPALGRFLAECSRWSTSRWSYGPISTPGWPTPTICWWCWRSTPTSSTSSSTCASVVPRSCSSFFSPTPTSRPSSGTSGGGRGGGDLACGAGGAPGVDRGGATPTKTPLDSTSTLQACRYAFFGEGIVMTRELVFGGEPTAKRLNRCRVFRLYLGLLCGDLLILALGWRDSR